MKKPITTSRIRDPSSPAVTIRDPPNCSQAEDRPQSTAAISLKGSANRWCGMSGKDPGYHRGGPADGDRWSREAKVTALLLSVLTVGGRVKKEK